MKIYLAPMEGITGWGYRKAFQKHFGQIDQYMTPFLSPGSFKGFTHRQIQEILPENNRGIPVIPQLLTCRSEDFIWAAKELKQLGYEEVNLNLGCPSGTVTAKKKGAGFLAYPEELNTFLYQIYEKLDIKISVKTRLGKEDPEEFYRLLQIYNQYPISELIIHPRVQKEFYKGCPHRDVFGEGAKRSVNPVCYNGDLRSAGDYNRFREEFPAVEMVMIGRGLIANPFLAWQLKKDKTTGQSFPNGELELTDKAAVLKAFHDDLYHHYQETMCGERNVLFRMKELWSYLIQLFQNGEKAGKKIRKSQNCKEYEEAIAKLFTENQLQPAMIDR